MAHTKSALKRVRQSAKLNEANRSRRTRVKNACKGVEQAATSQNLQEGQASFAVATQLLDRYASKGFLHKNKAARKKSRLAKKLNSLQASAK